MNYTIVCLIVTLGYSNLYIHFSKEINQLKLFDLYYSHDRLSTFNDLADTHTWKIFLYKVMSMQKGPNLQSHVAMFELEKVHSINFNG